ncbi:unnamed protein product [Adineta steineri]|uniref:VWFA domain-containing protein n=1 Tax=Adineta steineri TaxID=433720 RepID=A0A813NMR0_9BILA|nr:unnamed protein product [Adineta steineri]CAF0967128.1 unnamed protein product [Adineta steineri]
MDFGSKYVYKYAQSESESVSDDDDNDVLGNDADQLFRPQAQSRNIERRPQHQVVSMPDKTAVVSQKRKRLRKPDTNVLSITFNKLLQPGEMHAGDPVYCTECTAIASHLSKIQVDKKGSTTSNDTESKWRCEFCPYNNIVDIEQADLPKQEDATYLLSPAPVVHGSDMSGIDDSIVFFLIDISGSMASTTLVHGNFNLPNALKQQERAAEAFGGAQMIKQNHQTYVTRLQGVQMAVAANLDKLVKDTPTKRAVLLTFNHEITYYGDGSKEEPLVIRGDKLNSTNDLLHEAEREFNNELKPVSQTKTKLIERVYDLEETGQTALGPAVVFALNIASKRQGSKIVICTDGLANIGLGSLEMAQDNKINEAIKKQALHEGNQFYADLTERARDKGVSISVITIKGTSCLLPVIGQMADGTGGNVTIVDLLNIGDEFASILEQQVIATNVEATLIVHRGLYIRNPDNPDEKLGIIKRNIGNVTKQTEVTFEFGIRNKQEVKEKYHIDLDQLEQLPFQVQVIYTAADGSKALRVLTQLKEATNNRDIAEVNAVRSVIAENHIRSTANDMMTAISDDEEDDGASRMISKWSTPAVQKQRLAYMDNLNSKARSHGSYQTDQFNEKRWNKASNDLQAQVNSSRSRKVLALKSSTPAIQALTSGSSGFASNAIGDHLSQPFSRLSSEEETDKSAVVSVVSSRNTPKRHYGFATSNLSHFSDQHSEDLYRYKNISSSYMRGTSPERDDDRPPIISDSNRFDTRRNYRDVESNNPSNIDRFARRRHNDDQMAGTSTTSRFALRQRNNDNTRVDISDTNRLVDRRNSNDDDDDNQRDTASNINRSEFEPKKE